MLHIALARDGFNQRIHHLLLVLIWSLMLSLFLIINYYLYHFKKNGYIYFVKNCSYKNNHEFTTIEKIFPNLLQFVKIPSGKLF